MEQSAQARSAEADLFGDLIERDRLGLGLNDPRRALDRRVNILPEDLIGLELGMPRGEQRVGNAGVETRWIVFRFVQLREERATLSGRFFVQQFAQLAAWAGLQER